MLDLMLASRSVPCLAWRIAPMRHLVPSVRRTSRAVDCLLALDARNVAIPASDALRHAETPVASAWPGSWAAWLRTYWTVSVPVMLGWTSHQNVYAPAASAGTL
jgi:hypothetical protein